MTKTKSKRKIVIIVVLILVLVIGAIVGVYQLRKFQVKAVDRYFDLQREWEALGLPGKEVMYNEDGSIDLSHLNVNRLWIRVQVYNDYMETDVTVEEVLASFLREDGSDPDLIKKFADFYRDRMGKGAVVNNTKQLDDYRWQLKEAQRSEAFKNDHPDIAAIDFNDLTPEQLEILAEYIEE